jgi:AcrR family transcriptional regulator
LNKVSIKEVLMPRDKEENERIKDDRREKIEKAATTMFAKKGLAATKISDIASAAGMSLGLIYHYYSRKEELFEILVRQAIDYTLELLDEVVAKPLPAWEQMQILYTHILEGIPKSPQTYMMVVQALVSEESSADLRAVIMNQSTRYRSTFLDLIKRGQAEGRVIDSDPEQLVEFLFIYIQGLAMSYAYYSGESSRKITAETVLRFLIKPQSE